MILITDYGALAGLETIQTVPIQAAINECAGKGGGTVGLTDVEVDGQPVGASSVFNRTAQQ